MGGPAAGLRVLLVLFGALTFGGWRPYSQQREVAATAEKQRNFVPMVRVATVRASDATMVITLPGTTSAFAEANIFARATGYIEKRNVDIGSHVKRGAAGRDCRPGARSSDRPGRSHDRPDQGSVASTGQYGTGTGYHGRDSRLSRKGGLRISRATSMFRLSRHKRRSRLRTLMRRNRRSSRFSISKRPICVS